MIISSTQKEDKNNEPFEIGWATDEFARIDIHDLNFAVIEFCEDEPTEYRYCVRYAGAGHYCKSLDECRQYCLERASGSHGENRYRRHKWEELADRLLAIEKGKLNGTEQNSI